MVYVPDLFRGAKLAHGVHGPGLQFSGTREGGKRAREKTGLPTHMTEDVVSLPRIDSGRLVRDGLDFFNPFG
jgi:hypothetical protein